MSTRILIVEDDASLARMLRDNLVYEGFAVECAFDGPEALHRARASRPDLVLLDVMIPHLDGFEVCRTLSAEPKRVPIIIVTARTGQQDKVRGLELGADDYVTKPFSLDELLARIHAVLRRTRQRIQTLKLGDVSIDFGRLRAFKGHRTLPLTPREFRLLQHLVDIFISRLRRRIEPNPHSPRFIRTVHGDGYSLVLPD